MVSNYEHLPGGRNGEALKVKAQMQCASINLSRQGRGRQLPQSINKCHKKAPLPCFEKTGFILSDVLYLFHSFSWLFLFLLIIRSCAISTCFKLFPRRSSVTLVYISSKLTRIVHQWVTGSLFSVNKLTLI